MQIRRPTSARLFPADDTRTAFATSSYNHSDVNADCLSITRFIQAQGSSVKSLFSNLFPYNNNFVITSDGYFYHYHNDDNAVQNIPKGSAAKLIVRLNRVNDQIRANPCNMVDSFIDPAFAAMLTKTKDNYTICAVNIDHQQLHTYRFHHEKSGLQISSHTPILKRNNNDKTICDIGGCVGLETLFLVIAYTDGTVSAGLLNEDNANKSLKFEELYTLQQAHEDNENPILMTAVNGTVAVYNANSNLLSVKHFIKDKYDPAKIRIDHTSDTVTPHPLYRLHISPDGRFISGLQLTDHIESDTAFIFDTDTLTTENKLKMDELKFTKPVTDFVIDGNGQTAGIKYDEDEGKSAITPISLYGNISTLLAARQPATEEGLSGKSGARHHRLVNIFHKEKHDDRYEAHPAAGTRPKQP